jgi:hypothetical protein
MSKILQESFEKTVSRLAKRFKSEISGITLDIDDNQDRIAELPNVLKGQVAAFESLMAYKFGHLDKKISRFDERFSELKRAQKSS